MRNSLIFAMMILARPLMAAGDAEESNWDFIREALFDDRVIEINADGRFRASLPNRADNDLRQWLGADITAPNGNEITHAWLIVDENPVPISMTIDYAKPQDAIDFGASFRINRGGMARVIVEYDDGALEMAENLVKTSGVGACAAPPGTDIEKALETLGQMTLDAREPQIRSIGATDENLHIAISHPQHSGLQRDQISLLYIPVRFITALDIQIDGANYATIGGSISFAENPEMEINLPNGVTNINVTMHDSDGTVTDANLLMQ